MSVDNIFCMDANHFQEYLIPSARASWHSYSGGMYFVTICTAHKMHYFGEIDDADGEPQIRLSLIGRYVVDSLTNLTEHYSYAEIPLFVVMPNHIHALIIIDGERTQCRDAIHRVCESDNVLSNYEQLDAMNRVSTRMDVIVRDKNPMVIMQLGTVIRGLKARVTHFARNNGIPFGWQSRFYDRIVRSQNEMNRIATYIEENVAKWQYDELNCYAKSDNVL